MDFKLKLNLKSIIKFEQLNNISFLKMDYENIDAINSLIYCMVTENNDYKNTKKDFIELLENKNIAKKIYSDFRKIIDYNNQFNTQIQSNDTKKEEEVYEKETYIKDITSLLIIGAKVDANYILNDCSINDLYMLVNQYNELKKEDMESKRLFTYLTILPHIDGTKIDSPKKLLPFYWEIEEEEMNIKDELKEVSENFEDILKSQKEMMEKINTKK